jgi:uncharacterized protein YecE (DUF72 family)
MTSVRIGTAGWSIARSAVGRFPTEGSGLERYAARFDAAEINSSFHRPHRASTWQRWRESVPADFRFSVKVPKRITHELKLIACDEVLDTFVSEASGLGDKLAVLLVQLPPSLALDEAVAERFFASLRARSAASITCEPRHPSWFTDSADSLLGTLQISRVAADPARMPGAGAPGGWQGLSYWRLHGSPVMYRSSYGDRIGPYAELLRAEVAAGRETWCIFDNTASSAATDDALTLMDPLGA